MTSSYKPIGQFIRQVKARNKDLVHDEPKGININKVFMPSVANTTGTDLSKYRVVSKYQFAYNPMHVGRDGVLPIAMLDQDEDVIVSPAYVVFEICNQDELLPEYLMMWCRRPEFDRNAWFTTDSSVRGGFNWDDLCAMQLPVPDIDVQREIVREYNVIVDRIKLNEQLCAKLEETAQALYKHWFVDFEFPISADYAASIGKPELEGKPYKSNGGEMKYCELLETEIPVIWEGGRLRDLELDISDGNYSSKYPKSSDFKPSGVPFIRGVDFLNKTISPDNLLYISAEQHADLKKGHTKAGDILLANRGEIGKLCYITTPFVDVNINAQLVRINGQDKYPTPYLAGLFNSNQYKEELLASTTGSALLQLPRKNLDRTRVLIPQNEIVQQFSYTFGQVHQHYLLLSEQSSALKSLSRTILAKISVAGSFEVAA